jgi:hypothetical protein
MIHILNRTGTVRFVFVTRRYFLGMSNNISPEQTGATLRDLALTAAIENAPAHYRSAAEDVVLALAETFEPFTVEDLRDRAGDPPGHGCVMGALVGAALGGSNPLGRLYTGRTTDESPSASTGFLRGVNYACLIAVYLVR